MRASAARRARAGWAWHGPTWDLFQSAEQLGISERQSARPEELVVVVHQLGNGAWMLMPFDGADLSALRGALTERVLRSRRDLPVEP